LVSSYLRAAAAALGIVLSTSMIGALPAAAADSPGATAPAVTAVAAPAAVDVAQSDSDSFTDVPPNHWAYQAVQELAADGYIKGYPDGTFRGNRPLTRYEMAALTDRALSAIKAALINGDDVNARDIAALKKLMTQYAGDLKDVQGQVAALKAQQATLASQQATLASQYSGLSAQARALKAEADAATAAVARNRGGLQMSYKPATSFFDTEIFNGPYARAAGTNLAGVVTAGAYLPATGANAPVASGYGYSTNPNTPGASLGTGFVWGAGQLQNNSPAGAHAQGTEVIGLKPYIKGNLDSHFSYEVRLAWVDTQDTPFGATTTTPTYCTALTPATSSCVYQDVRSNNGSIPITVDRYFMQWTSGGVTLTAGKTGGGGGEGTRNVNQVLGFGKRVGGSVDYRNLKTDWLEVGASVGNPQGVPSIQLANINNTGNICASPATVPGLNLVQNGINPYCNGLSLEVQSHIQFFSQKTGTAVGFTNDALNQNLWTYWDAGAGLCATTAPNAAAGVAASVAVNKSLCPAAAPFPLALASGAYITSTGRITYNDAWISQVIGPKNLHQQVFQYDYSWRPGTDPFASFNHDCGAATCKWSSTATQEFTYIFASKGNTLWGPGTPGYNTTGGGLANSNVIYASVDLTGINGIVYPQGPNGPWEGVGDNLGISNYAGTQLEALQYVHWFSDNFNLNVGYVHQGTLPHTTLPIGGTGCPGCYVDHVNTNTLFVNSWMAF
jgi:hypothetical protein